MPKLLKKLLQVIVCSNNLTYNIPTLLICFQIFKHEEQLYETLVSCLLYKEWFCPHNDKDEILKICEISECNGFVHIFQI